MNSSKNLSPGFGFVHKDATRNPKLSPQAKGLYANIVTYLGKNDQCWPGMETLANDMGVSARTIIRLLSELEKFGVITPYRTKGKVNKYRVTHTSSGADLAIEAVTAPNANNEEAVKEVAANTSTANVVAKSQTPTISNNTSKRTININFEQFWKAYSKTDGNKQDAKNTWEGLKATNNEQPMNDADREAVMAGIASYVERKQKPAPGVFEPKQPMATNFLYQRRWETDYKITPVLNIPFEVLCELYGKTGTNLKEAEALWAGYKDKARCIILSIAMGYGKPFLNGVKEKDYQPGIYKFLRDELFKDDSYAEYRIPIAPTDDAELPSVEEIKKYVSLPDYHRKHYGYLKYFKLAFNLYRKRLSIDDFLILSKEYKGATSVFGYMGEQELPLEKWFQDGCKGANWYKEEQEREKAEKERAELQELLVIADEYLSQHGLPAASEEQFTNAVEITGFRTAEKIQEERHMGFSAKLARKRKSEFLYHLAPSIIQDQYREALENHRKIHFGNEIIFLDFLQTTQLQNAA